MQRSHAERFAIGAFQVDQPNTLAAIVRAARAKAAPVPGRDQPFRGGGDRPGALRLAGPTTTMPSTPSRWRSASTRARASRRPLPARSRPRPPARWSDLATPMLSVRIRSNAPTRPSTQRLADRLRADCGEEAGQTLGGPPNPRRVAFAAHWGECVAVVRPPCRTVKAGLDDHCV